MNLFNFFKTEIKYQGRNTVAKLSERMLRRWRKEALIKIHPINSSSEALEAARQKSQINQKILQMTQELLDNHLMKK